MPADFGREVHCLLGLPFDAVGMDEAERLVRRAATERTPLFLSTPNLNFLVAAQTDPAFRDSVVNSDLSIADGMPIVWLARVLGIPIRERVAGSDLFARLAAGRAGQLSVYFFGGADGVARAACDRLNAAQEGLRCVGHDSPGFGSIADMSQEHVIDAINASGADFLVVALGARKGQAWIEHNRRRIAAPVISHLGAVVNFVAGSISRAPPWLRSCGLEWLWRIKEEPTLWRRYLADGKALSGLLATRVLPYAWQHWRLARAGGDRVGLGIDSEDHGGSIRIILRGYLGRGNIGPLRNRFGEVARMDKDLALDMSAVTGVDTALIGLLMLVRGCLEGRGRRFALVAPSPVVRRTFRYCCAEYLCEGDTGSRSGQS